MSSAIRFVAASRRAFVIASLVAIAIMLPAAAQASSGPCLPEYAHGAQCHTWIGKVRSVNDGDTLDAYVKGDGPPRVSRVRFTGINTPELTTYAARRRAGECHAVDATTRVEQLVRKSGGRVRLAAFYRDSRSHGRLRRLVAVRQGGRWRDVGRILVSEGLALWMPNTIEDAPNARYAILAQRAAAAHRGLFSPAYCGAGPSEGHPLGVYAQWDADGGDDDNVNGEYVKIRNYDPSNWLPLDGWYVRDSGLRRFTFPPGAAVAPNGSVTVYAGRGVDGAGAYYWNLSAPVFENAGRDNPSMGDGAYLFDPQGDIRAWMIYPCRIGCTNPAQGHIALAAQPRGDEWISVTNTGGTALDMEPYLLKNPPYSYAFPTGTVLAPGETIRVHTQGDPAADTATDKHWGMAGQILNNGGDVARLETYNDIDIACTAYGTKSC